jgi:hypothetical protein
MGDRFPAVERGRIACELCQKQAGPFIVFIHHLIQVSLTLRLPCHVTPPYAGLLHGPSLPRFQGAPFDDLGHQGAGQESRPRGPHLPE